jgi:hypothetical protein
MLIRLDLYFLYPGASIASPSSVWLKQNLFALQTAENLATCKSGFAGDGAVMMVPENLLACS